MVSNSSLEGVSSKYWDANDLLDTASSLNIQGQNALQSNKAVLTETHSHQLRGDLLRVAKRKQIFSKLKQERSSCLFGLCERDLYGTSNLWRTAPRFEQSAEHRIFVSQMPQVPETYRNLSCIQRNVPSRQNGLLCERSRRRWWLCLLRGKLSHAELSWVFWCTVGQWAKENDICQASKFPEFWQLFSCIGWGMVENSGYVHLILVASLTSGLSSLTSTSYKNIQMDCSATNEQSNQPCTSLAIRLLRKWLSWRQVTNQILVYYVVPTFDFTQW